VSGHANPARVRLSIGAPASGKIFGTVALIFVLAAVVVTTVGVAMTSAAVEAANRGNSTTDSAVAGTPAGILGDFAVALRTVPLPVPLLALACLLGGLYALLYLWRATAWLDGTVVTKRGALLSRRADLASASVRLGSINRSSTSVNNNWRTTSSYNIPALVVTPPGRAVPLKIPLHGLGLRRLPASQLAALARAVGSNRGPHADRARAVGNYLRLLAESSAPGTVKGRHGP
jgi:hypothetical protein